MLAFLGQLLDPVMRPLFGLPGSSSLVVAMGYTSGFPVGAILTKKLYDEKSLNLKEAQHLLSFTNNSSPLFIIGAIGVGLLGSAGAGIVLLTASYAANLAVGLCGRFQHQTVPPAGGENPLRAALRALQEHQAEHQDNWGAILGGAIKNSLVNVLNLSGFIVLFSVMNAMCAEWGLIHRAAAAAQKLLLLSSASQPAIEGFLKGLFEVSLGAQALSTAELPLEGKLMLIGALLGFGGFSVNAQIMSIMAGVPIKWRRYFICRLLHIMLTALLIHLIYPWHDRILPAAIWPSDPAAVPYALAGAWRFSLCCLAAAAALISLVSWRSARRGTRPR
jgi:sporulation integral membrane protein YlbJ